MADTEKLYLNNLFDFGLPTFVNVRQMNSWVVVILIVKSKMKDVLDFLYALDLTNLYRHIGVTLMCWLVMFISVLIDMWDGVQTARVMKEKVDSKGLRRTFAKAGDYWRMMLFGLMFDTLDYSLLGMYCHT